MPAYTPTTLPTNLVPATTGHIAKHVEERNEINKLGATVGATTRTESMNAAITTIESNQTAHSGDTDGTIHGRNFDGYVTCMRWNGTAYVAQQMKIWTGPSDPGGAAAPGDWWLDDDEAAV